MDNVLITGATGFVGMYLINFLLDKNIKIFATYRSDSRNSILKTLGNTKNDENNPITWLECEITNFSNVKNVLEESDPDIIFHLAAQSNILKSWHYPRLTLETNIMGTLNILEAVRLSKNIDPKIQFAGSSEEYGMVYENETPIKETNPLRPLSPYAVSKVAADRLSIQYHQSFGLKTLITRAFNHTGPGRSQEYVTSDFCYQVARILKGKQEILETGNLEAIRDFTDVRDIVRAYWMAVNKCEIGQIYNISSDKKIKIGNIIEILNDITEINLKTRINSDKIRPSDVPLLVGDSNKFRNKTNWKPKILFNQTVEDILNYWIQKI